jgi:hypothetical protein
LELLESVEGISPSKTKRPRQTLRECQRLEWTFHLHAQAGSNWSVPPAVSDCSTAESLEVLGIGNGDCDEEDADLYNIRIAQWLSAGSDISAENSTRSN